jgi:uncharacterized RmlC-like cupin family protein
MERFEKLESNHSDGVVVVRPTSETTSRQRLPYYVGISETTAGAKNISMNLIVIPPAGAAEPHLHKGYETAIICSKAEWLRATVTSWRNRSSARKEISS